MSLSSSAREIRRICFDDATAVSRPASRTDESISRTPGNSGHADAPIVL